MAASLLLTPADGLQSQFLTHLMLLPFPGYPTMGVITLCTATTLHQIAEARIAIGMSKQLAGFWS